MQKRFPFSQTFGILPSWARARSSNGETAFSVKSVGSEFSKFSAKKKNTSILARASSAPKVLLRAWHHPGACEGVQGAESRPLAARFEGVVPWYSPPGSMGTAAAEAAAERIIEDLRRKHHPKVTRHSSFNSTGELALRYPTVCKNVHASW